jgi:hypothetical protein
MLVAVNSVTTVSAAIEHGGRSSVMRSNLACRHISRTFSPCKLQIAALLQNAQPSRLPGYPIVASFAHRSSDHRDSDFGSTHRAFFRQSQIAHRRLTFLRARHRPISGSLCKKLRFTRTHPLRAVRARSGCGAGGFGRWGKGAAASAAGDSAESMNFAPETLTR